MTLDFKALKPVLFLASFQFDNLVDVYCPICVIERHTHRSKRFKTTKSLYHHIRQMHSTHPDVKFVMQILQSVAVAFQMQLIKSTKNGELI